MRWRFENAEYDEAAGVLCIDGRPVAVEPRPLRLLAELLHHHGQVLGKDTLLASVWQGRPTVDHVLPSAMNRLRKALGPQASACIVTLPRQGYRFVGPLQRTATQAGARTARLPPGHDPPAASDAVPARVAVAPVTDEQSVAHDLPAIAAATLPCAADALDAGDRHSAANEPPAAGAGDAVARGLGRRRGTWLVLAGSAAVTLAMLLAGVLGVVVLGGRTP